MHSRVIGSRTFGARRALPWLLVFLALPVPEATAAPYLRHVAPPPLRSMEPAPIAADVSEATPAMAETPPLQEVEIPEPITKPTAQTAAETQPIETEQEPPQPVAVPAEPPPPILQDPLRERVNLEDFLPFFAPPAPPVPQAQPASSATYRRE